MPPPSYRPPFQVTDRAQLLASEIARLVGRYEGLSAPAPQPTLRRGNRIRTVVGSLAIEGNTLTLAQATAILDDKRVVGPQREIVEVRNAIAAYALAPRLVASKSRDLLRAHGLLMKDLEADAGQFRSQGVGIFQGNQLAHMAPPARQVPRLVEQLLQFVRHDTATTLVKAAVTHYELEFIHPFSDGNGRVGRLWQHVVLVNAHPVFAYVPVESVIHSRQRDYYRVLGECDLAASSTAFIEFALTALLDAFAEFMQALRPGPITQADRLDRAHAAFGSATFSRKDYEIGRAHV